MNFYLVGGAVRDRAMGLEASDSDWVVTGGSEPELEARGFHRVGRDFPVFLHPETREEHALPRKALIPNVEGIEDPALWADLYARDLTINAMALDQAGQLIDPWGGQADVEARVLRHVSEAFAEDPLRIIRVARFHARFAHLGFTIAPETMSFMSEMVGRGDLNDVTPERVWKEFSRALMTPRPSVFLRSLRDCGALARLLPEVEQLYGVPQPPAHHPEIDTGIHIEMCLDVAAKEGAPLPVRFAVLMHDLGKGVTPREEWPQHRGHEAAGVPLVKAACHRLRVPNDLAALAMGVSDEHLRVHRASELRPGSMVDLVQRLKGFKDPEFFENALWACRCDARGRTGYEERPYPSEGLVKGAREVASTITAQMVMRDGLEGPAIGEALRQARIKAVSRISAPTSAIAAPSMSM